MKPNLRWLFVILSIMVCLSLAACGTSADVSADTASKPISIEHLGNAKEPTRETLTAQAAKRIGIQTGSVRTAAVNGAMRTVIPYAAVLYDNQGNTWTYINSSGTTYARHAIAVETINGEDAVLSNSDLTEGTLVVTVGAEELFGAEFEFQEE